MTDTSTTDNQGIATTTVYKSGVDTVGVNAVAEINGQSVSSNTVSLQFLAYLTVPASSGTTVDTGSRVTFTATLTDGEGKPVVNHSIDFSLSGVGEFVFGTGKNFTSTMTDSNGQARALMESNVPGNADVDVSWAQLDQHITQTFVSSP